MHFIHLSIKLYSTEVNRREVYIRFTVGFVFYYGKHIEYLYRMEWEVWDGLPRGTYFPKDHFFVLLFFSFLFSFIDKENTFLILLIASPSGSTQRHLFLRSPVR